MIPLHRLPFEQEGDNYCKNGKRNHLLNHLELHQVEGSSIALKTNPVGRNGKAILEECNAPGEQNNENERPARGNFHLLQLKMAVPGERHENVREDEHDDGPKTLHNNL